MTKGYWYNELKKCFYINNPQESKVIKISAKEALCIIDQFNVFGWSPLKIYNKTIWETDVTTKSVFLFIDEYEKGLFDDVLEWICDNDIECKCVDKTEYLYSLNK